MSKHLTIRALRLAAVPLVAAACSDIGPTPDGWLSAHIVGAVQTDYEGTGYFGVSKRPPGDEGTVFGLDSRGIGTSAGQSFGIYRPGSGRPGRGRYKLAPLEQDGDGYLVGFTAYYDRTTEDSVWEAYTARSGEVQITYSSAGLVEGTFRFSGVLYAYDDWPDSLWDAGPNTITPGAPTIDVTGSFKAIPLDRLEVIDQHITQH